MKLNPRKNIFLKIISLLIAITLWFIVLGKNNPESERAFTINRSQIQLINTISDNSLFYKITENELIITLKGDKDTLNNLASTGLNPKVDVNRLKAGKYELSLSFSLPSNIIAVENYKAQVVISKS